MRRRVGFLLLLVGFAQSFAAARAGAESPPQDAIAPQTGVIKLFNGVDLAGLYTYFSDTQHEDPRGVVSVREGVLHISGDGMGGVTTRDSYRDYHMVCEFRWGQRTWHNRADRARDSGVLVHGQGPEGGYGGVWLESIEAQIIEGGTGDFIVVRGKGSVEPSLAAKVIEDRDGESVWHAGGTQRTFTSGRVNWFGRDPDWQDVLGFRGKADVESPVGQWTRMDVVCRGDCIEVYVNGVKVNEASQVHPSSGRLTLQSEMAEIEFRRWELWPLGQAPPFATTQAGGPQRR